MTTNMDAYTILYQAKAQIRNNNYRCKGTEKRGEDTLLVLEDMNEEEVRQFALAGLEAGIKQIRYEYPPNVSKRMYKYYHQNKDVLIDRFSNDVKDLLTV